MDLELILKIVGQWLSAIGLITSAVVFIIKIIRGQKCLLRNAMLTIYYKYSEAKVIGQYEFENFMMMYHAYKSLWGNSFIDKVCDDIKDWEIINPNGKKVEDPTTIPYYPRKKKKGR